MISAPDIGLATRADARRIALLSRDEVERGLRWAWTAPRVLRAIEDPDTNVVVARASGRLIGFALMKYDADRAHLLLLAVDPAHRRQRIATTLLAWLEQTLRVAGVAAVQVEVRATNAGALAFYAHLGFEPVNATSRYYQGVETAVHLVKELPPAGS
jgi:ribosomal-protein-alanine N-acetyltransferase